MKNLKYIPLGICLMGSLFSCTDKKILNTNSSSESSESIENVFKTPEEALNKGKNDLLVLLKNKTINSTINLDALERSKPEAALAAYEVSFERLISSQDSLIENISMTSQKTLTPLVDNNSVVTVITTSNKDNNWTLNEITNSKMSKDLTEIKNKFVGQNPQISLFEVPNINASIYEVKLGERSLYFTDYNGNSLINPISKSELLKTIRTDAMVFQRMNGELLKKRPLLVH
jgi:hypothetical protein